MHNQTTAVFSHNRLSLELILLSLILLFSEDALGTQVGQFQLAHLLNRLARFSLTTSVRESTKRLPRFRSRVDLLLAKLYSPVSCQPVISFCVPGSKIMTSRMVLISGAGKNMEKRFTSRILFTAIG